MNKNYFIILAAAFLQACTSFPAAVLPEVPNVTPNIAASQNARQMYFSSVKSRLKNQSIGQMKIGNACVNEKEYRWPNNSSVNEMFRDAIIAEFSNQNYPISSDTLDFKNQEVAEILIGAKVKAIAANICSAPAGTKGDAVLTVEWAVYDKVSKETLSITSLGKGHVAKLTSGGITELFSGAMTNATTNLVADYKFTQFVSK